VDLGAITNFWYPSVHETGPPLEAAGSRLTVSYVRIGGLTADLPAVCLEHCRKLIRKDIPQAIMSSTSST
jgi:NADH:ubiquinone oxidoreductase subunit D